MHSAVIFFVKCSKKRFERNDMHIIITLAQGPVAIRHTIYGADDVLVLVKRSVLRCAMLNLFPELLRKFSSKKCIVIRIYYTLVLAGKIKDHIADFDVLIA